MGKMMIAFLILLSLNVSAQTLKSYSGQTLHGQEQINEQPTGNICYVVVRQVTSTETKGHHCFDIEAQFAFNNDQVSKDPVSLMSRVTNYHRPEYPAVKSCAADLDGKTSSQEIYGLNTDVLYTPFFAATQKIRGTQYDYFLTIDPESKMPSRARVHVLKWFSERDYDCVNLKNLN